MKTTESAKPDPAERERVIQLFFARASLNWITLSRKKNTAKFTVGLTEKIMAQMNWREPDEWDSAVRKSTRLIGSRLIFKQSSSEIGNIEADIEFASADAFKVYRKPLKGKPGEFETRAQFFVRFACLDVGENLEPFLRKSEKPGSLKLFCKLSKPEPKQLDLKTPEPDDQAELELSGASAE